MNWLVEHLMANLNVHKLFEVLNQVNLDTYMTLRFWVKETIKHMIDEFHQVGHNAL